MSLKKKFLELKEQLSEHNNAYYNATTLISDLEYDGLKSKYEKFLQENPKFLELDDLGVGAKPNSKFKKIKHISRMLSLANSFNLDDLKDFFNKAENFLNKKISKNEFINNKEDIVKGMTNFTKSCYKTKITKKTKIKFLICI